MEPQGAGGPATAAWAGRFRIPALAAAVRAGYAAAGTDTGHVGGNADFVPGHPEKLIDFAYRAIHEMTVAAKALVGRALRRAPGAVLFQFVLDRRTAGADRGAALPRGFRRHRRRRRVVGSDAPLRRARRAERLRQPRTRGGDSSAQVPDDSQRGAGAPATRPDGVKDGVIENPARCSLRFRHADMRRRGSRRLPDEAAGRNGEGDGVADRRSRRAAPSCIPGRYYPGSELGWGGVGGPSPSGESLEGMKKIVFNAGLGLPHDSTFPTMSSAR